MNPRYGSHSSYLLDAWFAKRHIDLTRSDAPHGEDP